MVLMLQNYPVSTHGPQLWEVWGVRRYPCIMKPNFKIRNHQYWLDTRPSNANITHLDDPSLRRKNLHIQIVYFLQYI